MPDQTARLLGLAFAGADLALELDTQAKITFALGAAQRLTGQAEADLLGRSWLDLFAEDEADVLNVMRDNLPPGGRMGPMRIRLRPRGEGKLSRYAALSVFRMPQLGGRLSCALSLGAAAGTTVEAPRRPDGLVEAEAFPAAAMSLLEDAQNAGLTMRLDLVELAGLDGTLASLAPEKAEEMKRRVAATLRAASFGGAGASEVAAERFAVITDAETPKDLLNQQLLASTEGKVAPNIAHLALDGQTAAQNMRAMRYAIDRHMEDGPQAAGQGFMATVKRTMRDTTRFRAMLETRSFQLAYQPVVKLDDGRLHHFEALARFEADSSPADTIRLAEELDLITDFDMAVAESVSETLAGAADIAPIAINVSALSLMRPAFVSALVGLTAADPALRPRLMIEITETRRLSDLDVAHNVIADLRRLKHRVYRDDFGAGAASPDYLSRLEVDFVKIDGRYVQEAHEQPRDAVVLKHLAALCRELGIATIAEMVETREGSRLAKEVGVTLGQGYYYSRPLAEPRWEPIDESAAAPARRKGMVEQWG